MIQLKTFLLGTDKTSIVNVYCIKVMKSTKRPIALLGDIIMICINTLNMKKHVNLKARFQKSFRVGTIHRALIVRAKVNFQRISGIYIKFNENSIIIVNRSIVPLSNRVYGPILREFCMRWPSLGCVSICII